MFETIRACRSCGNKELKDILHLGDHPLANALVRFGGKEINKFSLSTAFCSKCSLFQLKETVSKEILFDHYVWVTGTSKAAQEYAGIFANRVIEKAGIRPGDLVFEIASNDGTILKQFMKQGMNVLGIDPAKNIVRIANEAGVRTDCSYWNVDSAKRLVEKYGSPKVVIARNVLPHVSDLHGVIDGIAQALAEDGTGVIEFHSGSIIAQELHYDSIYHEHLCYFTVHSLKELLEQYGLHPYAVDRSPISGGSVVLYFAKTQCPLQKKYIDLLSAEKKSGVNELAVWEKFAGEVREHREKTLTLLKSLRGKVIVGFGASARSATFSNFCGIGAEYLKAIIDNNTLKQGWMSPSGDVRIVSFKEGFTLKPDVIFILAWNFKDEIMAECARNGFKGQYFIPLPKEPKLVYGKNDSVKSSMKSM